ncbi:hypothetical protein [Pedobacter frigoris]|uniref:Uncharacterized protein n=1 Tax=Pedobacter frigoris TaxID=2571272 RepID=A0A4U1CI80_9SPHI|nr:hypothetical protein [Pedobacter frigoris]TKC07097.1 hypothetical protein FA047_07510 [Pedobacter frigoris]
MMNQEDIFKKIGQILNELQDQYDFLAQNPQQLNELELELFLANANFLSDHVQIVRKINNNKALKELPAHEESKIEAVPVQQEIARVYEEPLRIEEETITNLDEFAEEEAEQPEEVIAAVEAPAFEQIEREELQQEDVQPLDNTTPTFKFILNEEPETDKFEFEEKKSVVEIFNRPLSDEEQQIIAHKQNVKEAAPAEEEEEGEMAPEPFLMSSQPAFAADKVEEKEVPRVRVEAPVIDKVEEKIVQPVVAAVRPTLNDLLAAKNGSSHAPGINDENAMKPTIADLKGAINLNEKLLYIKDLFNGYNLAYSEAIDLINKMPDLKTADTFLKNNYAQKNNWEAKQATVDKFYDLLKQRFPES